MRFCLRPGAVSADPAARIAYCRATGIQTVQEGAGAVHGFNDTRQFDPPALRTYVARYHDAGIDVEAFWLGQITRDVVLGNPDGEADFARACYDLAALADAGVKVACVGIPIDKQPTPEADAEQLRRVAGYYNRLCSEAERVGVQIATHSPWPPNQRGWMWGTEHFAHLFALAPSPANGYLYDNAIHHMLGDDPAAAVRQFAGRIFFVHIRDVRTSASDGAAGSGYDEVFPGTGELQFQPILQALHDTGYNGVLCPEHFPPIPGDTAEATATAYAVGYLRGVLAQIDGKAG
jgi:sugar phosphate isomerase/epimerase